MTDSVILTGYQNELNVRQSVLNPTETKTIQLDIDCQNRPYNSLFLKYAYEGNFNNFRFPEFSWIEKNTTNYKIIQFVLNLFAHYLMSEPTIPLSDNLRLHFQQTPEVLIMIAEEISEKQSPFVYANKRFPEWACYWGEAPLEALSFQDIVNGMNGKI